MRPPASTEEPTQDELRKLLSYDRVRGLLTWRQNRSRTALAGDEAGTLRRDGSVTITIRGRTYQANRIIWLYMTGDWPPCRILARDKDRSNLKWTNFLLEQEVYKASPTAAYQREWRFRKKLLEDTGSAHYAPEDYYDRRDPRDPRNSLLLAEHLKKLKEPR